MKRTLRIALTTLAAATLLYGCGKSKENPEAAAKAAEPVVGGALEAAAKAGEVAAQAGEAAAKAGEAAANAGAAAAEKAGEAAAAAGEAAAVAGAAAAEKAGEAAALAGAAAGAAGVAAGAAAGAVGEAVAAAPADLKAALSDPTKATATAPNTFKVKFTTTKGAFVVTVQRDWAPRGADRFYNLVQSGFMTDIAFFRAVAGFMVQFGVHGDPKIAAAWRSSEFGDDPVKESNKRGRITFATRGPNTRTTQMFINFGDNTQLDGMGFAPFGEVDAEGMKIVDSLYTGYGEGAPRGGGPDQMRVQMQGNVYLKADFPQLDYLQKAELIP